MCNGPWIDISKILPTPEFEVWVTDGKHITLCKVLGREKNGYAIAGRLGTTGLTHWMELETPELPATTHMLW